MRHPTVRVARGTTLAELLTVMAIAAIAAAVALPRLGRARDRLQVRGAVQTIGAAHAAARTLATVRGQRAVVSTRAGVLAVRVGADTITRADLAARYGVRISATRDTVAYAPTGLGYGAANTSVVVTRGAAADTVLVSRLGRARW